VEVDWFHSTYVNKIDRKGRVSVPADFRAVLTRRGSTKVVLYPAVHFSAIEGAGEDYLTEVNRQIEALPAFSRERDDLIDAIMPGIQQLSFDSEGRVVLPEILIAHAKLGEIAAFVGRGQSFQIWTPEALERRQAEARASVQAMRQNGGRA
jgi:MraZ protein